MNNNFDELTNGLASSEGGVLQATTDSPHELEAEEEKRWARVVARAWDDEEFRQRLLTRPAEVMREAGFEVPDDAEIEIVERDPGTDLEGVTCLRLPPRPAEEDLIEDQLNLPENSAPPMDQKS